jgi:hypothetical protein
MNIFYDFDEYECSEPKKRKKYKIEEKDFLLENQLTNQEKLKNISDVDKYFYFYEASALNIANMDEDTMQFGDHVRYNDNVILLEYYKKELISFKTNLKNQHNPTKYMLTIISSYRSLLHLIRVLVSCQIVHNYIQWESIMVDNTESIVLSDFSYSVDVSKHNQLQLFSCYDPSYIERPTELHLLSFMIQHKLTSLSNYNIEIVLDDLIKNNTIIQHFGNSFVSSYRSEAYKFFRKYVNQTKEYIIQDIFTYYMSWDNFSVSILFLKILINLYKSIHHHNKFVIQFMKLLVCNIHFCPTQRFSLEQTNNQFHSILSDIKPIKQLIHELTSTS